MGLSNSTPFLPILKKNVLLSFKIVIISVLSVLCFNLHAQTPEDLINMVLEDGSEINDTLSDSISSEPLSIEKIIQLNEKSLNTLQNTQINLLSSYDTSFMAEEVPAILQILNRINERISVQDSKVNLQVLNELENLTKGYENQINRWQEVANRRSAIIMEAGNHIREIKDLTISQPVFQDTTSLPEFLGQNQVLANRLNQIDSLFSVKRLENLQVQSTLSTLGLRVNELREEIKDRQMDFQSNLFKRDNQGFWQPIERDEIKDLREIINETWQLNEVILKNYLKLNLGMVVFLGILFLFMFFWFRNMVFKITKNKEFSGLILQRSKYITNYTAISAALVVWSIGPYFFTYPPYSLILIFLLGMTLTTTVLIRKVLDRPSYFLWLLMVISFLVYGGSNLITALAYQEKWYLIAFSILGIWIGVYLISLISKKPETYPIYLPALVYFYLGMQSLSIIFHFIGRFSLGKMLGVTASLSAMQGICLYIFVLVVMEAIYLKSELSKENKKEFTDYINYQEIYSRVKGILSFLAILMWLYFLALNLSIDRYLSEQILEFLSVDRQIGNSSFTFGSILVFVLLIWFSSVLATNIAYFATLRDKQKAEERDKRLGSSILLIRLGILSIGFFLAVAASGIPLDKLAIVLGALSVGIGFGLQTVVNNLVSGIILAFERPLQIGDAIEVGSRSGIVKEVGIRSSTLQAYDGSEVIIPNGDLLSQHLINWTLSDKSRRIELIVGVAYGTDIQKVHGTLEKALDKDNILKTPAAAILLHNFGDSAIEFRILFWVANFDQWLTIKDQTLREIYNAFNKEKIVIPFPQRDLYIKGGMEKSIKNDPDSE